MECSRSVLYISSIRRNQEERTVIETARHIPSATHSCRCCQSWLRWRCELMVIIHSSLVILWVLMIYCSFHASYWCIVTVNTVYLKLVIPLIVELMTEMRVHRVCIVMHQLMYFTWWPSLKGRFIEHLHSLLLFVAWRFQRCIVKNPGDWLYN